MDDPQPAELTVVATTGALGVVVAAISCAGADTNPILPSTLSCASPTTYSQQSICAATPSPQQTISCPDSTFAAHEPNPRTVSAEPQAEPQSSQDLQPQPQHVVETIALEPQPTSVPLPPVESGQPYSATDLAIAPVPDPVAPHAQSQSLSPAHNSSMPMETITFSGLPLTTTASSSSSSSCSFSSSTSASLSSASAPRDPFPAAVNETEPDSDPELSRYCSLPLAQMDTVVRACVTDQRHWQ